jgi:hypothetical protein
MAITPATKESEMSKITLATFKSFIRKNKNIHIMTHRQFDGMVDGCVDNLTKTFNPIVLNERHAQHTLNIAGLWLVLGGGDRFYPYLDDSFKGITVTNCCGSYTIAIPNQGE